MEQLTLLDAPGEGDSAALAPLNVIRTETVLSKLPVHNLAKKGRVDIRILRKTDAGALKLKWEVSYNDRYGQPRQLAYKLDTLVVNKRIDDSERPLPVVIKIGSLKEICRLLGVQESGKNLRDVRIAFLQNASAFINAQFTYLGADGGEKRLEAGFTRYGVVFTGENLPDGSRADAVYITLNPSYWEVVNAAPFRPLNYDYLRELTPAAQRFYEIISFRVFAALKNGRPTARIAYSDYCAYSAQQRYYDHEHFRVQMYKIHRPHLKSGYIKQVAVEPTTDGEGKSDWILSYTPGAKARAEFQTFAGKRREDRKEAAGQRLEAQLNSRGGGEPSEPQLQNASEELDALVKRGLTARRAEKLISSLSSTQPVLDQIEWGDFLLRQARPGTYRNPPGFYFSLIRDDIRPPASFESSRQRVARQEMEKAHQERYSQHKRHLLLYEEYCEDRAKQALDALAPDEVARRAAKCRDEYARRFPTLLPQTLDQVALQAVRRALKDDLSLPSFEDFCRSIPRESEAKST